LAEKMVGPGRADVRVGVELDTAVRDRTEEHYEPAKTALRSEQRTDERANAEGATVAGVPGAASNLPESTGEPIEGSRRRHAAPELDPKLGSRPGDRAHDDTCGKARADLGRRARRRQLPGSETTTTFRATRPSSKGLPSSSRAASDSTRPRGDVIQVDSVRFAKLDGIDSGAPTIPYYRRLPGWAYLAAVAAALIVGAAIVLSFRGKRKRPVLRALLANTTAAGVALPAEASRPRLMPDAQPSKPPGPTPSTSPPVTPRRRVILREWLNAPTVSTTAHN